MTLNVKDADAFAACETIICDLDGTLYLDNKAIKGAGKFLLRVVQSGRKLFYFTNNTSASRQSYLQKIANLGFPADDQHLITAADFADAYLKRNELFPNIYLVGNKELTADFESRGFVCMSTEEAATDLPKAVVLGFDTELNYCKINTCYKLILRDIPYIATHADLLCPVTKDEFKPDIGSFIALFETATSGKRPIVVGKPTAEAVRFISEKAKTPKEKIAFIGDRLYTDIRMASSTGMKGILVLSGETNRDMLQQSSDRPDIIIDSVADLTSHL